MIKENKAKGIDLGLAVGLCTVLISAAYYCGNTLKNIPGNDEGLSLNGLPWVLATGFFAALSFTSFLALIGKSVITISEQSGPAWTDFSSIMFKFSVYVLIRWFILWGIPFFLSMSIFLLLQPIFGTVLGTIICFLSILPAFILVRRLLPSPVIPPDSDVSLTASLGKLRAGVIIIGCFFIAEFFVNSCYTFNVEWINSLYQKPVTMELRVSLKGVVNNKDKLAAEIYRLDNKKTPVASLDLIKYDEGKYMAWRDLDDLAPGVYLVEIFFRNYSESSILKRIQLQMGNNHRKQRFAFKLVEREKN